MAHIGVLDVLEREGFPVRYIAGTSAGSIIGALYAAGLKPAEIARIASRTRWRDLLRPVIPRHGLVATTRMDEYLRGIIGNRTFADLRIPLVAVACDLVTGEEVLLSEGDVCLAVRASSAVPGIFTPVEIGGRLLIDGGVCNNVPCSVVRRMGADVVVAVDVNAKAGAGQAPVNVLQVITATIQIMQRANILKELAEADLVIEPDLADLSLFDLDVAEEFIQRGREAALAAVPGLRSLLQSNAT